MRDRLRFLLFFIARGRVRVPRYFHRGGGQRSFREGLLSTEVRFFSFCLFYRSFV